MDMNHVKWVYNVIDGSREKELTIFRNELFTLQLDYKYNKGDIESLYLLALPVQMDLKSIRDLTAEHLPLLKSIIENSLNAIEEKLNVSRTLIKALFHYHPTFYHLHIHFAHVEMT